MGNDFYLKFHVGPVQEFIAAARRTQDLWMGSWLLAHLSRTAFQLACQQGATPVLPHRLNPHPDPTDADTPNHFLLRVDATNGKPIAAAMRDAVVTEWERIATEVKTEFFMDVPALHWNPQINSLLEIYWTLTPDDGSPQARAQAQGALEARKRLRDFFGSQQPQLKCTLCGLRQELSGKQKPQEARKWWETKVKDCRGRLRVYEDGSERLCAVCVVKRAALRTGALSAVGIHPTKAGHFPSTSNVAAATFQAKIVEKFQQGNTQTALQGVFDALHALHLQGDAQSDCLPGLRARADLTQPLQQDLLKFDGGVLYPEVFTENKFKKEFPLEDERLKQTQANLPQLLNTAIACLKALTAKDAVDAQPSKYFAVLMMDGDGMGRFFNRASKAEAEAMSDAMSDFASGQAKSIVNEHLGRMVYAGGDDVMALLPLEKALPCADALQSAFNLAAQQVPRTTSQLPTPTPSAGIAMAHHTAPLDLILLATRRAEHAAKQHYGRDAVCVHVLKRSGEEMRLGTHWQSQLALVDEAVALFREKILSMKFAYAVSESSRVLHDQGKDLCASELKRLVNRQRGDAYDKENPDHQERLARLVDGLAMWTEMEVGAVPDTHKLGLREVADWLLLARFIASGGQDHD